MDSVAGLYHASIAASKGRAAAPRGLRQVATATHAALRPAAVGGVAGHGDVQWLYEGLTSLATRIPALGSQCQRVPSTLEVPFFPLVPVAWLGNSC